MDKREKDVAVLTIYRPPDMSRQGRRDVANWIRRQAGFLERHADDMANRFVARYLVGKHDDDGRTGIKE